MGRNRIYLESDLSGLTFDFIEIELEVMLVVALPAKLKLQKLALKPRGSDCLQGDFTFI